MTTSSETQPVSRQGEGYLLFVGYLQVVAGVLTLLFSGLAVAFALVGGETEWLNPLAVLEWFADREAGVFQTLVASYVALQSVLGWLFGLLMIVAGVMCLKCRGRRFVTAVAVINLGNFPHGTTVAIMVLHGIARPGISGAFRR